MPNPDFIRCYIDALGLGRITRGDVDMAFLNPRHAEAVEAEIDLIPLEDAGDLVDLIVGTAHRIGARCTPWRQVEAAALSAVIAVEARIGAANQMGALHAFNREYRDGRRAAIAAGAPWVAYAEFRRKLTLRILADVATKVRGFPGGEFGDLTAAGDGLVSGLFTA